MKPTLLLLLATACTPLDPSAPGNLVRPTVDDDPTLPALDIAGTRLHVETLGPPGAPVVIMLHGGPGGDFRYLLSLAEPVDGRSLADDHQLVFWDQRGSGLSRRHGREDLDLAHFQADLEALVDAVSPDTPVVLLGHSWGAAYATGYMASHPERVRGAILVNPQALSRAIYQANTPPLDLDYLSEWLNDPLWARGVISPDDHARADFLLANLHPIPVPRLGNQVDPVNFRPGGAVFKHFNVEWTEDYDFTVGLDRFTAEVLLVASTADQIQGVDLTTLHASFFPRARIELLEGAGHSDPMTTHAADMVRLSRAYLDDLGGSR